MAGGTLKLRLSFDSSFDLAAAVQTAGQLLGAIRGALVTLDFSRCTTVDPTGLAHLTETIVDQGGRVELVGLSRHDLRILHYLVESLDVTRAEPEESD